MLSAIRKPAFVLKALSAYDGHYDMSIPVYQDLHNIFREGAAIEDVFALSEVNTIVDEYQNGRVTLQEAVDEIQRKAEFWAGE